MKLTPIIGSDYREKDGTRHTVFQLCAARESDGRLASIANVHIDGETTRCVCIRALESKRRAIIRLAGIYLRRSIPQQFTA